jgi:hypothetical protein
MTAASFVRSDLFGAVMRAVDAVGADIDASWLFDGESWGRARRGYPPGRIARSVRLLLNECRL